MAISHKFLKSIIATTTILGVGCSEKCGFVRNSVSSAPSTIAKAQPRPATWPPTSEPLTPSKTISPTNTPKIETAVTTPETTNSNTGIQPVAAQIPPPAPVSDSAPSGVVQAQRLETVPANKRPVASQPLLPAANPDAANLPLIPASGSGSSSTVVVPPPPPGSPLTSSAPLGIPSAPSGNPNR